MEILPQLLTNAFITGSIYAIAAVGLALTYGSLKILNFAHGHMMMLGAYVFYAFSVQFNLPYLFSIPLTILSMLLFAQGALAVFIKPFYRVSILLPFVTTLALSTALESTVSMIFGVNVLSFQLEQGFNSIEIYGIYITPLQIFIIASSIMILVAIALLMHCSRFGRKVRAISSNPHAAVSLGMSEERIVGGVFSLAVIMAAYAGVMIGLETNLQPTMGISYTLKAFAILLLGGLGSIWGSLAGSYLLGIVENLSIGLDFGSYSLPAGYKDAFAFVIILTVLLIRPQGIFGSKIRKE